MIGKSALALVMAEGLEDAAGLGWADSGDFC
jgi:hypothetical protein